MILISELATILRSREVLIVYRHQYWPKPKPHNIPDQVYPYVWDGLCKLRAEGLVTFAYQSQAASLFFVSAEGARLESFRIGFQHAFLGMSAEVTARRIVGYGIHFGGRIFDCLLGCKRSLFGCLNDRFNSVLKISEGLYPSESDEAEKGSNEHAKYDGVSD